MQCTTWAAWGWHRVRGSMLHVLAHFMFTGLTFTALSHFTLVIPGGFRTCLLAVAHHLVAFLVPLLSVLRTLAVLTKFVTLFRPRGAQRSGLCIGSSSGQSKQGSDQRVLGFHGGFLVSNQAPHPAVPARRSTKAVRPQHPTQSGHLLLSKKLAPSIAHKAV